MAESTPKFRGGIAWRTLRAVVNVISSPILIPFSAFAIVGFLGIDMLMERDERFVERGDEVHRAFHVVYEPRGGNHGSFRYASLGLLEWQKIHVTMKPDDMVSTFLMSRKSGELDDGYAKVSYRVIEDHGDAQVIEVDWMDDDLATWVRYRATASTIEPMWSRAVGVTTAFRGMAFIGLPFAVGVCLLGQLMKMVLIKLSAWAPERAGSQGEADKKIA